MKVLGGNFSAVDLCEEPCYTEPPEKGKFGGKTKNEQQNVKWWAAIKTGLCERVSAKPVFAAAFSLVSCEAVQSLRRAPILAKPLVYIMGARRMLTGLF